MAPANSGSTTASVSEPFLELADGDVEELQAGPDPRTQLFLEPGLGDTGIKARITFSEDDGATSISSVFTLCNSAIGAGVLSLPYAMRCSGALGCLLLCIVLGLCESFTLYVLSKFSEVYDAHTYGSLVRKALGRKLAACLSGILLLYLVGSCIAYLVIIGDTFSSLIALAVGPDSILVNKQLIIGVVAFFIILPLCFPRNLSALEWVSMAAVFGFIYTAVAITIRATQIVSDRAQPFKDAKLFEFNFGALFAIPIVVFGFNCHPNVVTIFSELDVEPSHLVRLLPQHPAEYRALGGALVPRPKTVKMVGMLGIILTAFQIIMMGYMAVAWAGYLAYPTTVSSNVLNTFPPHDPLMIAARAVIGCVVVGHFPINHNPARLAVEDLLFFFGWKSIPRWMSILTTFAFVSLTSAVSMLVTDLGAVLHMVGGTAASFMIFLLPGLLLCNSSIKKHSGAQYTHLVRQGSVDRFSPDPHPLQVAAERGIKETGFIYSPRKSWWAGLFLIVLSISILTITIATAIFPPKQ